MPKQSWLDANSQTPLIDEYTQKLSTFVEAMADGRVDDKEMTEQEGRLVAILKEVEPKLDDPLHARVTELLCELTAYNVMQTLYSIQQARVKTTFQG